MSEQAPVDAGGSSAASEPDQTPAPTDNKGVSWYKSEAQRAFEKRDEAKAKYSELKEKYEALITSKADAEGEVGERLKALQAERDQLALALSETKAAHREGFILDSITRAVPESDREAVVTLWKAHAKALDDGEADPKEIAEKAEATLKRIAPSLFKQPAPQSRSHIPGDGGENRFDPEAARKKGQEAIRAFNPAASGLGL